MPRREPPRLREGDYLRQWPKLAALWRRHRAITLAPRKTYIANLHLVWCALKDPGLRHGAIVECGVWRGGMACGLLEIGGPRRFHFFDSFEGLPPAKAIDGRSALAWQADTQGAEFHDNNRADEAAFRRAVAAAAKPGQEILVHRGWFADTMAQFPEAERIAVLRLDGDWYESTLQCLEGLFDKVLPGGLVIIDDYYTWDGCARAVHDFLSRRQATERLWHTKFGRVAYVVKQDPA